ncbi:MAG TPA: ScyD/ScyE family protein [Acidimicrobiia bacterium]|nr:ScyD/ScyE family protein [Acidimicrobiia bacterium]
MRRTVVLFACAAMLAAAIPALAADPPDFDYATPLFGLNADSEGNLLVSDTGQGIVSLTQTDAELVAELPGVSDAVETEDGDLVAVTGQPPEMDMPGGMALFRISSDGEEMIADLWEWEQANNPDQNDPLVGEDNIESNPYDVARIDGATLVADAAGNVLLEVQDDGTIEWKALFPAEPGSTQPLKDLVGCPDAPPEGADFCELPPELPAQSVPTSVAVGPDGNYYVGELTGFPGTPGISQIWQVAPDATNVICPGDGCTEVFSSQSFSAVIDVSFGADGTFYVLELDEDGFMAAEIGLGRGGTLNACDLTSEACVELATGMFISTASAVGANGSIYATTGALVPEAADVIEVGKEFSDDDDSVHELNIAALAAAGVTRGCNPPDNDEFCPGEGTTRGQMAAFLVRALDLAGSDVDEFTDDEGNIFEGDINAVAAAGITRGCNPPDNDEYCPGDTVTRGQMAAFLVRALDVPASDVDGFTDDEGSIFEGDINALKAAGITAGCNPPANDNFCPDDIVTRAQMASFLVRALDQLG